MTDKQIRDAINTNGAAGWNFVKAAGKHTLEVRFSNSSGGIHIIGSDDNGMLRSQLRACAAEIADILEAECPENFPNYQGITMTVDGVVPSPAYPYPQQYPAPPPVIIQPLPDTTPITTNDRIYYV